MSSKSTRTARRILQPSLAVIAVVLALGALPAASAAVPPPNDNYLSPVRGNNPGTPAPRTKVVDIEDNTEATVQADVFSPPSSGGGPETTVCSIGGVNHRFGRTIWYDFFPDVDGLADWKTAGFDTVIAIYEFDPRTARIGAGVCGDEGGLSDELIVPVKRGHSYSTQVGGFDGGGGPAFGSVEVAFQLIPDSDGDGVVDGLDKCPRQPGTENGCPGRLRSTPKLRAVPSAGGIRIRSLTVSAPAKARVAVRCVRRCRFSQARTAGTVSFRGLAGRSLTSGSTIEIRVTKPGFVGNYYRYTVTRGNFRRLDRCLKPGSATPRRTCL